MRRRLLAVAFLALAFPPAAFARGSFNPADEFKLNKWVPIHLGPLDLSITKAVAYLMLGTVFTILLGLVWGSFATDRPVPEQSPVINGARADGTAAHRGSWAALLRNSSLLWLTLAYSAVGYFQYLFFYWMQYYFDSVLSVGKVQSRWSTAIPTLVMAVCMPLGGWVSDQMEQRYGCTMGRKIVPMGGMLMSAALLGLGLITHKPAAMVFWFALSMGALGTAEGAFWLTAVELGGKRGGTAAESAPAA